MPATRLVRRNLQRRAVEPRGQARETSDVDLIVDFEGPPTFDGYMGLKLFLEDSLGLQVDLVTRAASNRD